jgi:sialidase-1
MPRFLVLLPVLVAALLLLVPVVSQAVPSLRVVTVPASQTVKAGHPATFTVAVKNTGDTFLSPIALTSDAAPECNRYFTGLIPGRVLVYSCSHRSGRRSYRNTVVATGNSREHGTPVSATASVDLLVERHSSAGFFGTSSLFSTGQRVVNLAGLFTGFPVNRLRNTGGGNTPDPAPPYLDDDTAIALFSVSDDDGTTGNDTSGMRVPLAPGDLVITPMFRTDVFTRGEGGYSFFMNPVLEFLPDGSLILFADAYIPNETDLNLLTPTIQLVSRRSIDKGLSWGPIALLDDPGEFMAAFNPSTMVDWQNGRLWVLYLVSPADRTIFNSRPGTNDMQTFARWSDDGGLSWSGRIDLTALARDMADPEWTGSVPGPGGAIQTAKGRLLVPVWKMPWGDFTLFSDDHGTTWKRGQPVPNPPGGNENQLVELPDGRILMDIRQLERPHRWLAESTDGGETWSVPRPFFTMTTVRTAFERFRPLSEDGWQDCILWTGPAGIPGEFSDITGIFDRWILVLRVSGDGGETFPIQYQISDEAASYSDMTILGDNTVGVAWQRGNQTADESIVFTRLEIHPRPRGE